MRKNNIMLLSIAMLLLLASKISAMEQKLVPTFPNFEIQRMSGGKIGKKRMEVTYLYTFKNQNKTAYMLSMQHGHPYFGWKKIPLENPILVSKLIELFEKQKFQDPKAIPQDINVRGMVTMIFANQQRMQQMATGVKEKVKKVEKILQRPEIRTIAPRSARPETMRVK